MYSDWLARRPTGLIVQLPWLGAIEPSEMYWNTSHSDPGLSVPATIDTVRLSPASVSVIADPGVRVAASEPPPPGVPPDVTVNALSGVNSCA